MTTIKIFAGLILLLTGAAFVCMLTYDILRYGRPMLVARPKATPMPEGQTVFIVMLALSMLIGGASLVVNL